jgi:hypothetical protein
MLWDDGKAEHHQYCSSPDLICHSQVPDPQNFFADNYDRDVTQAVDTNSRTNALYVRGGNLVESPIQGRIQVYRANASLFMAPSQWKNNKLYTAPKPDDGSVSDYVDFSADSYGIAVGETPFVLDGTQGNYCLVGIASDDNGPDIPPDFPTYDSFTQWVTSHPEVCVRNLSTRALSQRSTMELTVRISNPENAPRTGFLKVALRNIPIGATFGAKCGTLNNYEYKVISEVENGCFISELGIPPKFDDFISGYVITADVVPSGAELLLEFYYRADAESPVYHLGLAPETFFAGTKNNATAMLSTEDFAIVFLGSCAIVAQ